MYSGLIPALSILGIKDPPPPREVALSTISEEALSAQTSAKGKHVWITGDSG